jgi:sugar phosphate permease
MAAASGFKWKGRHTVLVILYITWLVSYLDRMVISTAIPYIAKDFRLSPVAMGAVMSAFFVGYSAFQIPGGMLVDRLGARKVMLWGLGWWTTFTAFTGAVSSLGPMIWDRALFGAGEGVGAASTYRVIANWFPPKERGTATAIMLSSNSLGPALAPIIGALLIAMWGWRSAFYVLSALGFLVMAMIWFSLQENPANKKGITAEELNELKEEVSIKFTAEAQYSFWQVFKVPVVWQSSVIMFLYDITVWGFRTWLPTYLVRSRGFGLMQMGLSVSLPFFAGATGYMLGGWVSDNYFQTKRKIPLVVTQWIGAVCLYFTYTAKSPNGCVLWMTLSGFFLFGGMGTFWALPMSAVSKAITGRAMAIVNTGGQVAGTISPLLIGFLVQITGGGFNATFRFMIDGTLMSSLFALLVKGKREERVVTASAGS